MRTRNFILLLLLLFMNKIECPTPFPCNLIIDFSLHSPESKITQKAIKIKQIQLTYEVQLNWNNKLFKWVHFSYIFSYYITITKKKAFYKLYSKTFLLK